MSESSSPSSESQPGANDAPQKEEGLTIQSETVRLPSRQDIGDLLFPALRAKLEAGDPGAMEQIIAYQKELRAGELKLQENAQRLQEKELDQKHELALKALALETQKEQNRIADENLDRKGRQRNIFLGLTVFAIVFIASLGYSYGIKDKEARVPIALLTTAAALLGGTALKAATSDKPQPKNQPSQQP